MVVIPVSNNATNALISLLLMYSANLLQSLINLNETSSERLVRPQLLMIEKESEVEKEEGVNQSQIPKQKNYSNYESNSQQLRYLQNGVNKLRPSYAIPYRPSNVDMNEEDRRYSMRHYPKSALSYYQPWSSRKQELSTGWEVIDEPQYQDDWDQKYYTRLSPYQNSHPSYSANWNSGKIEHHYDMNIPKDQPTDNQDPGEQEPSDQEPGEQEPSDQEPGDQESSGKESGDEKSNEKEPLSSKNLSTFIQPILHFPLIPLKIHSSPLPMLVNSNASDRIIHVYTDPRPPVTISKPKPSNDLESHDTLRPDKIKNLKFQFSENIINERNEPGKESSDHYLDSEPKEAASLKLSSKLQKADLKATVNDDSYQRFCYYLMSTSNQSNLAPNLIDPFLCTHIIIGYLVIDQNGQVNFEQPESDSEKLREIAKLTKVNKDLKIMISLKMIINNDQMLAIFESQQAYENLIQSILEVVQIYNLNGVDLWIDYNETRNGHPEDSLILKEIPIAVVEAIKSWSKYNIIQDFLVTLSVSSSVNIFGQLCDIGRLAKIIDFVNLMPFDCHSNNHNLQYTQHHNKLFPNADDKGYFANLNNAWVVDYWINQGMPSNKIMVGVATYAASFQLLFEQQAKIGSPAMSTNNKKDKMNYTQVCRFLGSNATLEFEPDSMVAFAHKEHSWIGYENEKTVSMKSRFVTIKKLAGVVTYALNYDDWKGECRKDSQTFPLQKAINAILSTESLVSF